MTTFDEVISLYYNFDKYKKNTYPELYYHILPSINLNQYKIFKDDKGIFGFVNWAYLNEDVEKAYVTTSKIYKNEWKSGVNLWLYDIVILRKSNEVMSWVYNYFKKLLKTNESISWLRLNKQDQVYRVAKKYKRDFHK
jgi:hemolysin-activating ACP:hemolysin acyltransferase|tara:strand:- start:17 stop:430 length:414 start_codon:yes stop_codon:yes gene_type:complete